MALEGVHHVTAITGDAPGNVDFYVRVLGLRMVKKTVNFDAPEAYHLYYGDRVGTPGSIMTFFEFPGARRGRAGAGMVHRVLWRVGSEDALAFWEQRLHGEGVPELHADNGLRFTDHEGIGHELFVLQSTDAPLTAEAAGVPPEHAIQGFHGVRAYAGSPDASAPLLDELGFGTEGDATWRASGDERHGLYFLDTAPLDPGVQGAGTVHHVAWSAADDSELAELRERALAAGAHATEIIDRQYFHSVYFREPSGVLFELATRDIGFHVDEPLESLGRELKLPPRHEHLRERLERTLTPLPVP